MGRILVIVHQETSNPGLLGEKLRSRGYRLEMRCPALGDPLPTCLTSYAGVVVLGGPMSANDDDTLPFIRAELDWLPTVLTADIPYLGICLGAQLLARVLGAQVQPHPTGQREIGYFPLRATVEGRSLFPEKMWVYHWHGEGFDLPPGATHLATGDTFPHQAFRYGDMAYGLQFHPEISQALIEDWTVRGAEQLTLPGAHSRDRHLHDHQRWGRTVDHWLTAFLDRWLAQPWCQSVSA
ncbi:MAG: glutamine amidotransferase [Leptolyngbyaceae cyanobacterium T60_A2020_046]|nr:glutamine amidotransferase [Leptolyngbyaceae cyanobacterium T60_A2020_046]